jgi:hypothetical protein
MPCNYAIESYTYVSTIIKPTTTYVSTTTMQPTTRVSDLVCRNCNASFHCVQYNNSDLNLTTANTESDQCSQTWPFVFELYIRIFSKYYDLSTMVYSNSSVYKECLKLNLLLKRNLIRKHDYKASMLATGCSSCLVTGKAPLDAFITHHVYAYEFSKLYLILCTLNFEKISSHAHKTFTCNHYSKVNYIAGGVAKLFTYEELLPHLSEPMLSAAKFKFHSYITEEEAR